jgi:ribosomal protein S27AE
MPWEPAKVMRQRHICPKCSHRTVLLIKKVRQTVGPAGRSGLRDLCIASVHAAAAEPPFTQAGTLSAAVCEACGFVEWYVSDPSSITVDGDIVTKVSAPNGDPYR